MNCAKCHISKDSDGFYSKDRTCKECRKIAVRNNRKEKFDYYSAYEKKRNSESERKAALQQRAKEWRAENPEAYRAQTKVGNALRDGKISKSSCLFCGRAENVHAHHNDYSKPLDVIWLCPKCHHRAHANFPAIAGHSVRT